MAKLSLDTRISSPFGALIPTGWKSSLWASNLFCTQNLAVSIFARAYLGALLIHYAKRWTEPEVTLIFLALFVVSLVNFRELLTFFLGNVAILVTELLHFPRLANHTNLAIFVAVFALFLLFVSAVRQKEFPENCFVNGLRGMAITLYFYVGFHKINSGFLDLTTSCTTWYHDRVERTVFGSQAVIPEFVRLNSPIALISLDLLVCLLLIFPRTWLVGLALAVPIHLYVSVSGFTDFSAMMHSVMLLFLPVRFWRSVREIHKAGIFLQRSISLYFLGIIFYVTYSGLSQLYWYKNQYQVTTNLGILFNLLVLEITCVVAAIVWKTRNWETNPAKWGTNAWPGWNPRHALFPALIFIWGAFPYLFGSQTSLTMFSNLVTESQRQNHLIIDTNNTKIFDFEANLIGVGLIDSADRPPSRYELQGYLIPESEFRYIASISSKDPNHKISMNIETNGHSHRIESLAHSEFSERPLSSYFLTFRQIDPYGSAKCRW